MGTVVFIAYLSALCTSPAHTATQFALLTAFASFGRTTLASITGFVAAATGWIVFFMLCAAAAIPGLLILWILIKRGNFEEIEGKERAEAAEKRLTGNSLALNSHLQFWLRDALLMRLSGRGGALCRFRLKP